jgi:hypothetical protein
MTELRPALWTSFTSVEPLCVKLKFNMTLTSYRKTQCIGFGQGRKASIKLDFIVP